VFVICKEQSRVAGILQLTFLILGPLDQCRIDYLQCFLDHVTVVG